MRIYLKNNPAEFHPDPIWNNKVLGIFEQSPPNKNNNHKKKKKKTVQGLITERKDVIVSVCLSVCL